MPITLMDLISGTSPSPNIPQEVWTTLPAGWGRGSGELGPDGVITAGGTQYADNDALQMADWQANLRHGTQEAIQALPAATLDKYWPAVEDKGPETPYGTGSKPAPGDPLGGWFNLMDQRGSDRLGSSAAGPSTNNWRLLPYPWNQRAFIMRNGHLVDKYWIDKPLAYVNYRGGAAAEGTANLGGGGWGFPISFGSAAVRGYFWPGQLEPWLTEGGTGVT
jgi:hypothetical protein